MDFLKKCCQCICCSQKACGVAACIDIWHSYEACGLANLYCEACCWTLCAPICIDCKMGETDKAMDNYMKGIKYCAFSCGLYCASCADGCYNCFQVIKISCGQGIKGYADMTKNASLVENKLKGYLNLETGNEPLKTMGTFTP